MRSTTFLTRALQAVIRPRTEHATGIFMILAGALLVFRPYAPALTALQEFYGVVISVQVLSLLLFVCGGLLLLLRHVSHLLFYLLILPISFHATCLWWALFLSDRAPPFAPMYALFTIWLIIRAHAREIKVNGIITEQKAENLQSARDERDAWDAEELT